MISSTAEDPAISRKRDRGQYPQLERSDDPGEAIKELVRPPEKKVENAEVGSLTVPECALFLLFPNPMFPTSGCLASPSRTSRSDLVLRFFVLVGTLFRFPLDGFLGYQPCDTVEDEFFFCRLLCLSHYSRRLSPA